MQLLGGVKAQIKADARAGQRLQRRARGGPRRGQARPQRGGQGAGRSNAVRVARRRARGVESHQVASDGGARRGDAIDGRRGAGGAAPPVAGATANYLQSLVETAHARRPRRDAALAGPSALPAGTLSAGSAARPTALGFFLAGAQGRRDPAAELDATLRAFLAATPRGDEHAAVPLPGALGLAADARWASTRRGPRLRACPNFETWRTGISAEAVTLVYATAYLNSPASMYGHTFLRLSRSTGEGNPLLDYAVNFAADVDTENGLLYAMKGVAGRLPGPLLRDALLREGPGVLQHGEPGSVGVRAHAVAPRRSRAW